MPASSPGPHLFHIITCAPGPCAYVYILFYVAFCPLLFSLTLYLHIIIYFLTSQFILGFFFLSFLQCIEDNLEYIYAKNIKKKQHKQKVHIEMS